MPIQFSCHSCGLTLSVKDEFAGRACKCKCGAVLKVPIASNHSIATAGTNQAQNMTMAQPQAGQQPGQQRPMPPQQRAVPQQQRPPAAITPNQQAGYQQPVPNPMAQHQGMQQMPFGQQEEIEYIETVSKSISVESVQCVECDKNFALKAEHYGRVIQCPCGAPVRLIHPLGYVPEQQRFAKNKQIQAAAQKTQTDDDILNQYINKDSIEESNQKHGY